MQVKVEVGILLARYSRYFTGGRTELVLEAAPGSTIADLVDLLGIPRGYISFPAVNGTRADFTDPLRPGDEVILFPYLAGG
ncbi:MAG: MoaD/ThiS family protein [Firmicutes bacterium]|nr:MoaD/ThiS family protein [Bacillota bacterium]